MKIIGFLQNFNGVGNGDLKRCLESMQVVVDDIFVYDDASTEETKALYDEYGCTVIYGLKNQFSKELHHKSQLLKALLSVHPDCDWICWYDSDAVLGSFFDDREAVNAALERVSEAGLVQVYLHNTNLWRSETHYRSDIEYDNLWHCVFWRNTGELHYDPSSGLHQKQFPIPFYQREGEEVKVGAIKFQEETQRLIHYGFATLDRVLAKYFTYKREGQTGYPLDRLVSETGMLMDKPVEMTLHEMDLDWYPASCRPDGMSPVPEPTLTPEMVGEYKNLEEALYGSDENLQHLQAPTEESDTGKS